MVESACSRADPTNITRDDPRQLLGFLSGAPWPVGVAGRVHRL